MSDIDDINSGNDDVKAKIHQQLTYQYPYQEDTLKPSKQSVSELKRHLKQKKVTRITTESDNIVLGATYERPRF